MIIPAGLAIDSERTMIYVVDQWGARVNIYEFMGEKYKKREGMKETGEEIGVTRVKLVFYVGSAVIGSIPPGSQSSAQAIFSPHSKLAELVPRSLHYINIS